MLSLRYTIHFVLQFAICSDQRQSIFKIALTQKLQYKQKCTPTFDTLKLLENQKSNSTATLVSSCCPPLASSYTIIIGNRL